jgi:hypothetical protein
MADNLKSLVIISDRNQPGLNAPWSPIVEPENFSKGIKIPDISKDGDSKVDIGSIVSGMPTVFARANMFANAIKNDSKEESKGLMFFYSTLISEWKGLISCIALDYKNFKVDRIPLGYSDNKGIGETSNPYEVTGAFGNALFDRKELWCDQKIEQKDQVPFIDVIRYNENGNNQVVGGTSPDSFLFTSSSYELKGNAPYINKGKFTNPFADKKSDVSESDLIKIYGYALYIKKNLEDFRLHFSNLKDKTLQDSLITSKIGQCLDAWIVEMTEYVVLKGYKNLSVEAAPPEVGSKFLSPFGLIFNYSTELYGVEGLITNDASQEGVISFDPNDLLLSDTTQIAQIRFEKGSDKDPNFLAEKPILVLKAEYTKEKDRFAYFTLPVTPLALNIFGKNLDAFVGLNENSGVKSRITALYDDSTNNGEILTVTLKLFTNTGQVTDYSKIYKVGKEIKGKDILMWPNFISKQWNRYFLYSEMPHNDPQFQATPFVGDVNDDFFRIIFNKKGAPLLLAENSQVTDLTYENKDVTAKLHINFNNAVANNSYHYEIYESNQPFKGIKFSYAGDDCGYAIIRYDEFSSKNGLPKNKLKDHIIDFAKANLGIDFGSTNTSVAYYSTTHGRMMDEMKFKNRRISLLGSDNKNNDEYAAVEDEVFFFQNEEIRSNSIKSVLTIHDSKRIVKDKDTQGEINALSMAIKGGFPNFEKNLPIESASENRYKLNFDRAGYAEIVHNMKWNSQDIEIAYKKAYLSSLLLHVYAHLFEDGHEPVKLKWSYPSSMGSKQIGEYIDIWQTLPAVNPIKGGETLFVAKGPVTSQDTTTNIFGTPPVTSGGWGSPAPIETPPAVSGGWGIPTPTQPTAGNIKEIKEANGPIKFNFQKLTADKALTESCAVANFLANNPNLGIDQNYLTLCFDVGGSTTDISVLCQMQGPDGLSLAMVKQNSIRFAAQRVASATQYSPNFKAVLLDVCERKNISIQGLNVKPDKYSPSTASYFFEQIIDRLDENDFPSFYELLRSKCPEMLSVNLYVTGLIMYYAGQLANKLRADVSNSVEGAYLKTFNPAMGGDFKPIINIVFAGKGARIFDWFKAIDAQAANKYYTDLFIAGFGGMQVAQSLLFPGGYNGGPPIRINPTNEDGGANLKYEVSKGLAFETEKLLIPQNDEAIEILGEEGFMLVRQGQMQPIPYDSSITTEMMENIGTAFMNSPQPGQPACPKFMQFASIYYQTATGMFGLDIPQESFMQGFNSMNINSYIKNLPEYRTAIENKKSGKFDFVAPIIILEGMKFMEDVILKGISNK